MLVRDAQAISLATESKSMPDTHQLEQSGLERLRLLLPLSFVAFFLVFGVLYAISPAFASVVGQAFGGLNEAVVAMVAWCRSF